jgi:hypothetical protein
MRTSADAHAGLLMIGAVALLATLCVGGWIVGIGDLIDGLRTWAFVAAGIGTAGLTIVAIVACYRSNQASTRKDTGAAREEPTYAAVVDAFLPPLLALPPPAHV